MKSNLEKYLGLEDKLTEIRSQAPTSEDQEDEIMDELERAWYALSDDEQNVIRLRVEENMKRWRAEHPEYED